MISYGTGARTPLFYSILLLLAVYGHCNLQTLVEDIAYFDNATDVSGTELCIFTTSNSTLAEIAPGLLQRLVANYPTVYLQDGYIYVNLRSKMATMVLLDGTAFEHKVIAV
ncbi:endonuclease [Anopheles sinensis]|uniref:Endonuclease n=1 Tax=Anopheles sinensis TaxID=74873 RepID=A0A084VJY8_ANOSI|nr:endonuclease [Anopheles sinensis]